MYTINHFIGGQMVTGHSGRFGQVYDPSTGKVQGQVALANTQEVTDAVANATAAQVGWAATNPQKRARVMFA